MYRALWLRLSVQGSVAETHGAQGSVAETHGAQGSVAETQCTGLCG